VEAVGHLELPLDVARLAPLVDQEADDRSPVVARQREHAVEPGAFAHAGNDTEPERQREDAVEREREHRVGAVLEQPPNALLAFEHRRAEKARLQAATRAKQDAERAHLQKFIDRFRAKASKATQAQSRIKRLAKLEPIAEIVAAFVRERKSRSRVDGSAPEFSIVSRRRDLLNMACEHVAGLLESLRAAQLLVVLTGFDEAEFVAAARRHRFDTVSTTELSRFPLTPIDLRVAPFHAEVLAELARVPYGRTETYGALAAKVGRPRAARAVGTVMNRNPIPIVLPCHRVVGSTGKLVGYAGGLERKQALLRLEGALA